MKSENWKWGFASRIMVYSRIRCPICREEFRLRVSLRKHLSMEHSLNELKGFLKRKC